MAPSFHFRPAGLLVWSRVTRLVNGCLFRHMSATSKAAETASPELSTREARADDLAAVLSFGSAYGGRDFMATIYPRFMSDPNIHAHVHYVDGELAGFTAVQLIDNGESALWRAARMKPGHRRRSTFGRIIEAVRQMNRARQPPIKWQTFSTTDDVVSDVRNMAGFRRRGIEEIYRKRIINKLFRSDELRLSHAADDDDDVVKETSPDDVMAMSTNETTAKKFFPQGKLFAHSMYLKLMEENLPELISANAGVYVTTTTTGTETRNDDSTGRRRLTDSQISNIDMITTAFYNDAGIGLQYEVDLLANSGLDSLDAHIRFHVGKMKELAPNGRGVLMLTITDAVDEEVVSACLDKYGITEPFPGSERHIIYCGARER